MFWILVVKYTVQHYYYAPTINYKMYGCCRQLFYEAAASYPVALVLLAIDRVN